MVLRFWAKKGKKGVKTTPETAPFWGQKGAILREKGFWERNLRFGEGFVGGNF